LPIFRFIAYFYLCKIFLKLHFPTKRLPVLHFRYIKYTNKNSRPRDEQLFLSMQNTLLENKMIIFYRLY